MGNHDVAAEGDAVAHGRSRRLNDAGVCDDGRLQPPDAASNPARWNTLLPRRERGIVTAEF